MSRKLNTPYVSGIEAKDEEETTLIGYVGIDTGTLAIGDPVYIDKVLEGQAHELRTLNGREYNQKHAEQRWLTVEGDSYHVEEEIAGALIDTGIGDGLYPVYVTTIDTDMGRRVSRVEIVFMEDDEEVEE